jgi:hypothetical protein
MKNRRRTHTSVTKRSRLLCGECGKLERVVHIDPNGPTFRLQCGHSRPELLPVTPGHVSLEQLETRMGHQLFPVEE